MKKQHGGKRKGAGRPPKEERMERRNVTLDKETIRKAEELGGGGARSLSVGIRRRFKE